MRVQGIFAQNLILFLMFVLAGCAATSDSLGLDSKTNKKNQTNVASLEGAEGLSPEDQRWLSESCSRSLGPSLWSKCVEREMDALKSGKPDISELSIENQNWILESCDRSLGPRLAFRCMEREKAAFEAGMPDLSRLSQDQKRWLDESCSKSLGPSLYRSCIERESSALLGGDSSPNQSTAENENSAGTELDEKKWLCKAPFGGEVVVKLTYNGEDGFVTMLDQEFEGRYRTEGLRRIWYFGEAEDSDSYRYSIVLDVRGIARFYDFSDVEEDGSVRSQETLKCVKN